MKNTLLLVSLLFMALTVQARPVHMTGSWFQSGYVEVISLKDYRYSNSKEETQDLKQKGYTCRQNLNRTLCEKFVQLTNPVHQNILKSLLELAPKNVQLHPTQEPFHSIHESMSYNEWGKRQSSVVDGVAYTRLHWREVSDSPARVILSRDQDSEKIEFLVSEKRNLIRMVSAKVGTDRAWQRLTALIHYRSLR